METTEIMDGKRRYDHRKYFLFFNVIVLLLVVLSISAEEDDHFDYGESVSVLISSYDIITDKMQNQYDDEVQIKIDFLKNNGYSQIKIVPSFFRHEIYYMVYGSEIGCNEGYAETIFTKNGIRYILTYTLNKPEDPNFLVTVTFEIGDERYWFLKINYLMEYSRIEEWLNLKTDNISVQKLFY